jgi:hypothetical protein
MKNTRLHLIKHAIISCFLVVFMLLFPITSIFAQSSWPAESWNSAVNLTGVMDANGLTELSGLHWNPVLNRLYIVDDKGRVRVLSLNIGSNTFSQIANKSIAGGPEGITQVDYNANEFYTIDENNYEIRKYTYPANFSSVTYANHWNLLAAPSPMPNTGNTGPEGIAFVPDNYLKSIGFIGQETGQLYTSVKGMGGLIFIANQDGGNIWVFDVNPSVNNDFAYVGKYKTNRTESCELEFDRSTGLLYILHNTDNNTLEVTNLTTTIVSGGRKFVVVKEYQIPNPEGNINIEGFAITPKCDNSTNVSAWLCRDVSNSEDVLYQKDCIRWFQPFSAEGTCGLYTNQGTYNDANTKFTVYPNPVNNLLSLSKTVKNIEIFNLFGELVYKNDDSEDSILTSGLKEGIYILKCNKGVVRFIVMH